ncbi:MAG: hypothetical protein ACTHM0_07270 [Sphingomonas sp.]
MKLAIDENVLAVANDVGRVLRGEDPHCPQANDNCRESCVDILQEALVSHQVLLDSYDLVFSFYRRKASLAGQPGSADAFLLALYQSSGDPDKVIQHELPKSLGHGLPTDFVSCGFDTDDMIYIALARSEISSCVVNAVDSDYREYAAEIADLGVTVKELCGK